MIQPDYGVERKAVAVAVENVVAAAAEFGFVNVGYFGIAEIAASVEAAGVDLISTEAGIWETLVFVIVAVVVVATTETGLELEAARTLEK